MNCGFPEWWDTFSFSHLSVCFQFSTIDIYNFSDLKKKKKGTFLKGKIWPKIWPEFVAFVLPPLSPLPHRPVFSPDFNWRHRAVLSVSLKKARNPCGSKARQKPGPRSSPLLPISGPPAPHAASSSTVLISGDAKQTQRRNYKHQRQRPINSWVTDSSLCRWAWPSFTLMAGWGLG